MPTLNEKIAASLERLRELGTGQAGVLRSKDLSRTHLERLLQHGYLRQIMPGWVMVVDPSARMGDSTPFFANFWRFLSLYCEDRFGPEWAADAQTSLRLHAGENTVPRQVIVVSPKGNNLNQAFPFNTSLFSSRGEVPPSEVKDGMRVMPLGEALVKASPSFFAQERPAALAALASLGSSAEVLDPLIRGGHSVIAGRLATAFRSIGRIGVADEIVAAMTAAGHRVTEGENPLQDVPPGLSFRRRVSPVAARITALWAQMRTGVLETFEDEPTEVDDTASYLSALDERYVSDAYHSLSIEGYQVTPELIDKIRRGEWSPERSQSDRDQRNALAAKGYADCFKLVRGAVADILGGANPAAVVSERHMQWFRAMFQPSVAAGLFLPERLAGYRQHFIYLDGSRYVPVAHASVQDAMDAFFDSFEAEEDPRVRAVLGHFVFTYIHPLPDGNGRIGRFIMNSQLASGGYPWTVIPIDERQRYMQSLDAASLQHDIRPFAGLAADLVRREPPPPRRRAAGEEPAYLPQGSAHQP
ncbi:Fic family protein [Microvirga sp. ACRRW]|uniref:Fic family protein n=1 Tax=Microvirga sp. ACRRW TaxID=2918205 RepID=UPI001EF665B8|nr:Fic family protein [Microvirga sp. ACRRW]MCG7392941.1 Fic family protein [Microvirga sp. ACRRW]